MRPNITLKEFLKKGVSALLSLGVIVSQLSYSPQIARKSAKAEDLVEWVWGDTSYDFVVDSYDASLVLRRYTMLSTGQNSTIPQYDGRWDTNFDGCVDASDASLILQQYAKTSTGGYVKYMDSKGVYIRLPKGRTFSGVAVEEGMSQAELEKLNPEITDINNLHIGQIIYVMMIPGTVAGTTTKTTTTKETSTATKAITTTKSTTKNLTATTTTMTTTATKVTDKPVTTIQTKPITGFENGKLYMLAPGYVSWRAFSDIMLNNEITALSKNQVIQVEYTEKNNIYIAKKSDGSECYFKVSPENYQMWVQVEHANSSTTVNSTAIEVNVSTTTIEKKYVNYEMDWKIRSEKVLLADDSNVVASIKAPDPYLVLKIEDGWEYVYYHEVYGWMYTAQYSDNFVVVNSTTTTPVETSIVKVFVGDAYNPEWNVRAADTKNSDSLGMIQAGETYTYLSVEPTGWEKVLWQEKIGYIETAGFEHLFAVYDPNSTTTITTTTATTTTATTAKTTTIKPIEKKYIGDEAWKVRCAPTTSSDVVTKIPPGKTYLYMGMSEEALGWEKVIYDGKTGFLGTYGFEHLFVDANQVPVVTTPVVASSNGSFPDSVLKVINSIKSQYPGCQISASAYEVTGKRGYSYNGNLQLYAGCSFKAYYSTYAMKKCETKGIDIDSTYLEYKEGMRNDGSGVIKDYPYGSTFSIEFLRRVLIRKSCNTSYNVQRQLFPMWEYKASLNSIGGQQLISEGQLYGAASSKERVNEWVAIWQYINSGTEYANRLKADLCNAYPNFLGTYGTAGPHKSGSSDYVGYICASDAGIVYTYNGNPYILAVVVQDALDEIGSANAVRRISQSIIDWVNNNGIF